MNQGIKILAKILVKTLCYLLKPLNYLLTSEQR
jgi:hypothetical protein